MKISIDVPSLKKALNTCNELAPTSSAIAEEKTGVLLRASGESVIFMSSDDTSSVKVEVPAVVKDGGEALVRCASVSSSIAATFSDQGFDGSPNIVQLETTAKATLKVIGKNTVGENKSLNHVRNFPLLNAGFFIETPEFDQSKATQFPVFKLMDGLNKVSHAASKDASKLHLNCVSLTLTDTEIIFAATDGIQIAEFRKAAEVQSLRGSFILGLKFSSLVAKIVNPTLDFVEIYTTEENLYVKSGGTVLVGSLINIGFPKYSSFINPEGLKCAVFPRDEFLEVLLGMQPTVDAKSHRLVVDARKTGKASLATSSTSGEAESSDLEVKTPEDFVLHFDSRLLQGAVRQLEGEKFELYFTEDAKGVLLKSPKDDDFKAYVCTLKKVE